MSLCVLRKRARERTSEANVSMKAWLLWMAMTVSDTNDCIQVFSLRGWEWEKEKERERMCDGDEPRTHHHIHTRLLLNANWMAGISISEGRIQCELSLLFSRLNRSEMKARILSLSPLSGGGHKYAMKREKTCVCVQEFRTVCVWLYMYTPPIYFLFFSLSRAKYISMGNGTHALIERMRERERRRESRTVI